MLKRILLPLEPSVYGFNARETALRIAAEQKATVTALAIVDRMAVERQLRPVSASAGVYVSELRAERLAEIQTGIDRIVSAFKQAAEALDVRYHVISEEADPRECVVQEAMFHDLVIMGQKSDFDFNGQADPCKRHVQAILNRGVAPVLVMPKELPHKEPETVLVAFNGSLPAGRALQRLPTLPWIDKAKVKILMADTNEDEAVPLLTKAAEFLLAHDISNVETIWTANSINDTLSGEMMDWADLIVAGAHARKVLDFILGSVAVKLIDQDRRAVMICG